MTEQQQREEEIFYQAIEKRPGGERDAFLEDACGSDARLRCAVIELLEAYVEPASLLDNTADLFPAFEGSDGESDNLAEQPGDEIGRYKLLQCIGEGGFGSVWMAEQMRPVTRRVALKITKLGMDTKEVIARFEAERQALAMMDHPNIAKILDAGATKEGRPYFVMELVKGIPINRFCDERKMGTRARLKLFVDVCEAVSHAHQKGLIHRDLKPTNILVTLIGDKPVPKIIDFGIAKATQTKLTDKTLFTRFEQFVGTPVYMSPEQAVLSGLDIDTRSDIYSLGVLLYELLTGKLPFDPETLRTKDYDELRRIIREEEPPRPSNRLGTLAAEERTAVAEAHQANPHQIQKLVRDDLDWVVMKAIEKDRARRYETANAFAEDIQRFLDDEPVTAAAPTAAYRFRKFAGRNKGLVTAASAIALALFAGTTVSLWQMRQAKLAALKLEEFDDYFIERFESFTMVMPRLEEYPDPGDTGNPPLVLTFGIRASDQAWEVYDEVKWILQPIRDDLEDRLDRTVVIKIAVYRDYQKLLMALDRGEIDFVRCGGNPYILGHKFTDGRLQVMARHDADDKKDENGEIIDQHGRVIIREELWSESLSTEGLVGLKKLIEARQARGEEPIRVAFGSPYSGSGRIRIQEMLARAEIHAGMVDWDYHGRHSDVAKAVANGKADIGGIKFPTYEKYFLGADGEGPRMSGEAFELAQYTYPEPATAKEPEMGGKGKPWVSSPALKSVTVGDRNLFDELQGSLARLDLKRYRLFWDRVDPDPNADREAKEKEEELKKAPDRDYPLPIIVESDGYYDRIRRLNTAARVFLRTFRTGFWRTFAKCRTHRRMIENASSADFGRSSTPWIWRTR